jgi:ERAP1-like C-terminal domain
LKLDGKRNLGKNILRLNYVPCSSRKPISLESLGPQLIVLLTDGRIKEEARKRFQAWQAGNQAALPPYLRRVVFGIVLSEDPSTGDYQAILETLKTSQSADGKEIALSAIGDVKSEELIKRTIDFILSGNIAAQDIHSPGNALAGNTKTRDLWWETMKAHWE